MSHLGYPRSSSVKLNPAPTGLSMYSMWLSLVQLRFLYQTNNSNIFMSLINFDLMRNLCLLGTRKVELFDSS